MATSLNDILDGHVPLTSNRRLIESLTTARESRFLGLMLAPDVRVDAQIAIPLLEVLDSIEEGGSLDVMVDAFGGANPETWRIVSILRERFDRITAVVPFAASPGATQVALGANELLMGEAASLSPIEPPRLRRVDTQGHGRIAVSSHDLAQYVGFLKEALGVASISPDSPSLGHVWEVTDPIVVAATEKSHRDDLETTKRCLGTHLSEEAAARVMRELGGGSHKFPITRRDCESRLGLNVIKPARDLWSPVWALYQYYEKMFDLTGDMVLGEGQYYTLDFDGFIDTLEARRVLIRVTRTDERGHPVPEVAPIRRWVQPVGREVRVDTELEL